MSANAINTTSMTFDTVEGLLVNTSTISTGYMSFDIVEGSLINVSTISTIHIDFNTMNGSTISTNMLTTNELTFSSLCMIPSTISSVNPPVNGFSSSILICLDGSYWQIPIFPV